MPKFCSSCGKELEENATTCSGCGKTIVESKENTTTGTVQVNQTIVTPKHTTNGMAIAGFVISLVSLLCCGSTSFLGLIFSIVGLVSAKNYDGDGKGLAIAGIILSSLFVILFVIFMSMGILASIFESASYSTYYY